MRTMMFFLMTAVSAVGLTAQNNSLYIQHPQQTWRGGTGTITQATLAVRQKGAYFQHDLYLTIAAIGLGFTTADSVEVQMNFSLPAEAMVNDLWLWMDDKTIMQGLIMDRWTASNIYENIVKRRRDPALLMKNGTGQYSLRIYPLPGTGSRKVKISYLVPMTLREGSAMTSIPTHIVRVSSVPLTKMTILVWKSDDVTAPEFQQVKNGFQPVIRFDSLTQQQYYYGEVPSSALSSAVTMSVKTKAGRSVFVSRYVKPSAPSEGFYQVSFVPSTVFNMNTGQKIVFLFEFDESKSGYSSLSFINTFKSFILTNLSAKDSFNLIFSGSPIKRIRASGWFGGDSASIESAFSQVSLNAILNADNMQALITDGASYLKANGGTGSLWLMAGTDKFGNYAVANPLLLSLRDVLPASVPVHITDLSNWSVNYYYINGRYYYGNEYFYENLSRLSGGFHTAYRFNSNLQNNLTTVMDQVRGTIQSFDLITRVETGFCSNRYAVSGSAGGTDLPVDRTVTQVGQFNGQFPFIVEIAGIYKGATIGTKMTVNADDAIPGDSTVASIWAGHAIAALEAQYNNSATKKAIDLSLTYRVLGQSTAFLALEPNDTLKACVTCRDESGLVSVREDRPLPVPSSDSLLSAFPNPFNPATTLRVRLPHGVKSEDAALTIVNVLGQSIRRLETGTLTADRASDVQWNGTDDAGRPVASGIYLALLTAPGYRHSVKLMLMK